METKKPETIMNQFHPRTTATVILYHNGKEYRKAIQIDEPEARCLAQLPKDHDFPGIIGAMSGARCQREQRMKLAEKISQSITEAIMDEIEAQDPIKGYQPEEYREFYKPIDKES